MSQLLENQLTCCTTGLDAGCGAMGLAPTAAATAATPACTTSGGGGRTPSICILFMLIDCRNKGRLFCKVNAKQDQRLSLGSEDSLVIQRPMIGFQRGFIIRHNLLCKCRVMETMHWSDPKKGACS